MTNHEDPDEQRADLQGILDDLDGNVPALVEAYIEAARFSGWPEAEIRRVLEEAMSGDLDHFKEALAKRLVGPDHYDG